MRYGRSFCYCDEVFLFADGLVARFFLALACAFFVAACVPAAEGAAFLLDEDAVALCVEPFAGAGCGAFSAAEVPRRRVREESGAPAGSAT